MEGFLLPASQNLVGLWQDGQGRVYLETLGRLGGKVRFELSKKSRVGLYDALQTQ